MRITRDKRGFTLVELLVALMVTSIVLTAVVTLAYAMGSVNDATDDTSQKQAQLRYSTLKISEYIRGCKLICGLPGDDLVIWRADDNDDGQINVNELVYIESGAGRDYLQICEFSSVSDPVVILSDLSASLTKATLKGSHNPAEVMIIPQCSGVQFRLDVDVPQSKFVSILFDVVENEAVHQYQINAALRSWAGYLLDGDGDIVSGDDD